MAKYAEYTLPESIKVDTPKYWVYRFYLENGRDREKTIAYGVKKYGLQANSIKAWCNHLVHLARIGRLK